jgi:hypothetical protein
MWIAYPLLKFAKNLFWNSFSLHAAKLEKPKLFMQRLRSQSFEYGIYSIDGLNELGALKAQFASGLFLEVHHIATLLSSNYTFRKPTGKKETHIYFFTKAEWQHCKDVTHRRVPLYVIVRDRPLEIKPLVKDEDEDDTNGLSEDPDA